MDKNSIKLLEMFKKIADKGYIQSTSNGLGAIGLTFEKLLGKKADSMFFPDFRDIEIKCTSRFSRYPISLFSVSFDGPTFPEINRIIEKYGYPDSKYKDKKVFYKTLDCKNYVCVNNYFFKFEVDKIEDKLYLCVYDKNMNLIERKSYVYLDKVCNHLKLKLKSLAIVYASKKVMNNNMHFRYYKIRIYKLKEESFLRLLKYGFIKIDLAARISKSGLSKGRYKNKNLVFKIKKDNILKLFDEVIVYDNDKVHKKIICS